MKNECCKYEEGTFTWTLHSLRTLVEHIPHNTSLESCRFTTGCKLNSQQWYLSFFPNGRFRAKDFSLWVVLESDMKCCISAAVDLCMSNCNYSKTGNIPRKDFGLKSTYYIFDEKSKFLNGEVDQISLSCKIKILNFSRCREIEELAVPQLLDWCDVTFNVDGKKFRAHKHILSQKSKIFERILANDNTDEVQVYGTSPIAFEELLKFIYSGNPPNLSTFAEKLLPLSSTYELKELKRDCLRQLICDIDVTNVVQRISLAEQCHEASLRAACLRFIVDNISTLLAE